MRLIRSPDFVGLHVIVPFNTSTCQSLSSFFSCSGWTNPEKDPQVSYLLHTSFYKHIDWPYHAGMKKLLIELILSRGKHPQVKTQESTASRDPPITFALLCYPFFYEQRSYYDSFHKDNNSVCRSTCFKPV